MDASAVLTDLADESAAVDRLVADLPEPGWQLGTSAAGWTIGHQIAHLTWTDEAALLAITDPDRFGQHLAVAGGAPASFVDDAAAEVLRTTDDLLGRWRTGRAAVADAIAGVAPGAKIPWYGTAMSATSLATARLMETWAHGLDIAQALGVTPVPSVRLRHVAYLGHRTLGYAFLVHGRPLPTEPVRVELAAPDGTQWTFGPADATNLVTGSAWDFSLLVTQRAHRDDLDLVAAGPVADEWLDVAQAFAGPPGPGRAAKDPGRTTEDPGAAATDPGRAAKDQGGAATDPGRAAKDRSPSGDDAAAIVSGSPGE